MITLQSIMNFERGQTIEYYVNDSVKIGVVQEVYESERRLLVLCNWSAGFRQITPMDVKFIHGKKVTKWSEKEKLTVKNNLHLPNEEIALLIGRTWQAIAKFKSQNGLSKR